MLSMVKQDSEWQAWRTVWKDPGTALFKCWRRAANMASRDAVFQLSGKIPVCQVFARYSQKRWPIRWLPFKAVLLNSIWTSPREKPHCPRKSGRGRRNETIFVSISFPGIVGSNPKPPKQGSKGPRKTIYLFSPGCFWLGIWNYSILTADKQGHGISLSGWEKEKCPP